MGTKNGWKSIEFKTGFIGMNYYGKMGAKENGN
jgi:hypothetical protein